MRRQNILVVKIALALGLFASACGGGTGDDPGTSAVAGSGAEDADNGNDTQQDSDATAQESSSPLVSSDGRLSVILPAGADGVSIGEAKLGGEIDGLSVLYSYSLEPDGATFDTPVELRISLSKEQLAAGVFGVLRSSDGTEEALEFSVADDDQLVTFVDHFSDIEVYESLGMGQEFTIVAPPTAAENRPFAVSVSFVHGPFIDETRYTYDTSSEGWLATAPLRIDEPDDSSDPKFLTYDMVAICLDDEGTGSISFGGEVDLVFQGRPGIALAFGVSTVVKCVGPKEMKILDQQCPTSPENPCVLPPETIDVIDDDGTLVVRLFGPGPPPPDATVTVSLSLENGSGDAVLVECTNKGDCQAWAPPSFFNLDSEWFEPDFFSASPDGEFDFNLFAGADGKGALQFPGGESTDGTVIPPGEYFVRDGVVYVDQGDSHSVTVFADNNTIWFN